jgi:hypothetical protein
MSVKSRYNISLPDHVSNELELKARLVGATPTEYAGDVIRWWFGQGCPPVTSDEIVLRRGPEVTLKRITGIPANLNVWVLDKFTVYRLMGDEYVSQLMKQLHVPALFADRGENQEEEHAIVGFDNHPTHWIVLHHWTKAKALKKESLIFEAEPKASTTKSEITERLSSESLKLGMKEPFLFSHLPVLPGEIASVEGSLSAGSINRRPPAFPPVQ